MTSLMQSTTKEAGANKRKRQDVVAALACNLQAQHLATAFVQFLLPEGQYDNPRKAAIQLLKELPAPLPDVEARTAQCVRCQQSLMGQAWEVSG